MPNVNIECSNCGNDKVPETAAGWLADGTQLCVPCVADMVVAGEMGEKEFVAVYSGCLAYLAAQTRRALLTERGHLQWAGMGTYVSKN